MGISLAFLGTGTCNATRKGPPALAVSNGEEVVAIDFGGGAYHQLARLGSPAFNYKNLSTVVITHFHNDHVSGFPDLFWGEMFDVGGRRETPLTLVGPHGLTNFYQERLMPFLGGYPVPFEVRLVELAHGEHFEGPFFSARAVHLEHAEFSNGYRFAFEGRELAVTGDTSLCDNLYDLLRGSDAAVLEWALPAPGVFPGHLSNEDMARLIAAGVLPNRVFVTHVYPVGEGDYERHVDVRRRILGDHAPRFVFPDDLQVFEL